MFFYKLFETLPVSEFFLLQVFPPPEIPAEITYTLLIESNPGKSLRQYTIYASFHIKITLYKKDTQHAFSFS